MRAMQAVIEKVFSIAPSVRYVAVYLAGKLASSERPGLANSSSSESDTYEEIIVNPTLLTLVRQRGGIDCGGMDYVLIRYGNFFELVHPIRDGHISIGIEPEENPLALLSAIRNTLGAEFLLEPGGAGAREDR